MKTMLIMLLACVISQSFFLYTGGNSWSTNGGGQVTDAGYSFTSLPATFETYFYTSSHDVSFSLSVFLRNSLPIDCNVKLNFDPTGADYPMVSSEIVRGVSLGNAQSVNSYNKIIITITGTNSATSGLVEKISIEGDLSDLVYVTDSSSFYWGRRGASARLNLGSSGSTVQYFATTMSPSMTPIGSYFIAIGFEQGQFGLQVNSATQRRVVFSVASGYQGKNPQQIPDQYTVELVKSGPGVTIADCTSQGSGGQSFLRFDWERNGDYKFLVKAQPLKHNATTYTAWFWDEQNTTTGGWRLIASWTRPKIRTNLTGIYHSVESFSPNHGNQEKSADFEDHRYYDHTKTWKPFNQATVITDAIKTQRRDTIISEEEFSFALQTNAFNSGSTSSGTKFTRDLTTTLAPFSLDLTALPF